MITIDTFGYQTLTEAVNQMKPVPGFISNLLFKRRNTNATTSVLVDIIVGAQKVAPIVKRGNAAKVIGNLGLKSNLVEPPMLRYKKFLTPADLFFTRGAGAPIFVPGGTAGNNPIQNARQQKIALEQKDMRGMGDRTIEMLCCLGLAGSYSINQDDGVYSIDFQMPNDNKPNITTASKKWTAPTTATPLKDMRDWKKTAKLASGKIPNVAVMNSTTWECFIACTEVLTYLDKLKINLGSIETQDDLIEMGAEYKGKIDGIKYYTYDAQYVDANGATQYMIPDYKVALVCPTADHRLEFGAVEDLKSGTVVAEYFSKDWVVEDPSGLYLLVEAHPLPCFNEPGANIFATVSS